MKFFTTLALVLFLQSINCKAQKDQLYISYEFNFIHYVGNYQVNSLTNHDSSLQTIVRNFNLQTAPGVVENITEKRFIYKDLQNQRLYYNEELVDKILNESLQTMKWSLTGVNKEILGYQCNEARSTWRGRDYIAYFTTELPFKTAPWKFHGLPGVILEIYSTDEKLKIEATALKLGQNLGEIKNIFKDKKTISWHEFIELNNKIQKKQLDWAAKMDAQLGATNRHFSRRIELLTKFDIESDRGFHQNIEKIKNKK